MFSDIQLILSEFVSSDLLSIEQARIASFGTEHSPRLRSTSGDVCVTPKEFTYRGVLTGSCYLFFRLGCGDVVFVCSHLI